MNDRSSAALQSGINGEQEVVSYRQKIARAKHEVPRWEYMGWKLVHDGVRGEFDKGFEIPTLTINDLPLRGVPDLVFKERKTGRIMIVELKVSEANLPSDGWPNLRAQLWAYSRIDKWSTAPEILLAGEVWSAGLDLRLRRTYLWRKGDEAFEMESKELFEAYGGRVVL